MDIFASDLFSNLTLVVKVHMEIRSPIDFIFDDIIA